MNGVLKFSRAFAALSLLAIVVGISSAAAVVAGHRGMCGDGDFRPSCAMFAAALDIYGMIGLLAVTALATVVTFAVRRRPPALLKRASLLSGAALAVFLLSVRAAGNKLAGAIVVIAIAPVVLTLLGAASLCVLIWLLNMIEGRIERRAAARIGV